MKTDIKRVILYGLSLLFISLIVSASVSGETEEAVSEFIVPPPPLSEGIYPCNKCHEILQVNTKKRELEMYHTEIKLKHAEEKRWCLDCHNAGDRDKLRLANGELVEFEKSYTLCGQCHGPQFNEWKDGIHGKRTGLWNGLKIYRLCVHCHDPHQPHFKKLKPEEAPLRPDEIKLTSQ